MKKLLFVVAACGCACLAQADTMSFITVLSSPVGSFNKLETADPSLPAYGKAVNFCTRVGVGGVVELKGTQPAVLGAAGSPSVAAAGMYLSSGTTLGKTDAGKYSLNNIALQAGGSVTGGRLVGDTVQVNYEASGKAEKLYGDTLTVAAAKTKNLYVAEKSAYIEQKDGQSSPEMVWSNEYQADDACKEASSYAKCKQQYLLKSKGASLPGGELLPIDPVEYEYYWSWTNSDSPTYNAGNNTCIVSCLSMADAGGIEGNVKPIAVTRDANSFSPACDASNVGKKCMTGGTQQNGVSGGNVYAGVAGAPYCPEYTCMRKQK